jgi:RNA polymerase sigma-70 factor (ECF subfamily)
MARSRRHTDPEQGAPQLTDDELIRRCLGGNPDAYRVLVERYWSMVYSVVRRITDSHDDAVDVTQEAFVRAYEHLADFARDAKFSTWLLRVATNYALDQKRRKRARQRLQVHVPVTGYAPPADSPAILRETESRLSSILRTLTHHQRLCLVLKVVHGMTTSEVADILGCSEGTVRVHLHQARKTLRDKWDGWRA